MGRNRTWMLAAAALLAGCSTVAPGGVAGARPAASAPAAIRADAAIADFARRSGVEQFTIVVMRGEEVLLRRDAGGYGAETQIPIASASKWLVGATIMSLVDEGLLDLDEPVSRYVPNLPPEYGKLPLSQLMSYTAGLPSLVKFVEFRQPPSVSLTRSAQLAAQVPLASEPGTQFDYGGANFQFLGAAAEQVTGKSWHEIFAERIAQPLGMTNTLWGGAFGQPQPGRLPSNPMLQAGAWTTASDYAAFAAMIAQDGSYKGRRIVSARSIERMRRVMTIGVRKGFTAPGAQGKDIDYLLAHWCERRVADLCTFESSPGLYGTYPWVDRDSGLHGVIFLKDRLRRIAEDERALRNTLIELYR